MKSPTPPVLHRPKALIQAETFIGNVLRYGVIFCGSILVFGLALCFVRPESTKSFTHTISELRRGALLTERASGERYSSLARGVLDLDPHSVIALGLILLIALPITRVALTVGLFLLERDYIYFGITFLVLVVLLSSLIFGKSL